MIKVECGQLFTKPIGEINYYIETEEKQASKIIL